MKRIKIFGAGSIGNHLANAACQLDWEVVVCDVQESALTRMKTEIYPARYGAWDDSIELHLNDDAPRGGFDLIHIGTPPTSHLPLAMQALEENPRAILIEWIANYNSQGDAVIHITPGSEDKVLPLPKKRPDDFLAELRHIEARLEDGEKSPLDLEHGLDAMLIIAAAAHKSEREKRRVTIDYSRGYCLDALQTM